jgi:hypothetical protein
MDSEGFLCGFESVESEAPPAAVYFVKWGHYEL